MLFYFTKAIKTPFTVISVKNTFSLNKKWKFSDTPSYAVTVTVPTYETYSIGGYSEERPTKEG